MSVCRIVGIAGEFVQTCDEQLFGNFRVSKLSLPHPASSRTPPSMCRGLEGHVFSASRGWASPALPRKTDPTNESPTWETAGDPHGKDRNSYPGQWRCARRLAG